MLLLLLPPALGLLQRYFRSTTTTAHFESLEIYGNAVRASLNSFYLLTYLFVAIYAAITTTTSTTTALLLQYY